MANASEEMLKASVLNTHNRIKQRVVNLLQEIAAGDEAKVGAAAEALKLDFESLIGTLAPQHRPSWIEPVRGALAQYSSGKINRKQLILTMSDQKTIIDRHNWNFDEEDVRAFDFDQIFHKYRTENNLVELFDKTIDLLKQLMASRKIESAYAREAIERLIATMEVSKKGSLFSMDVAWQFFVNVATNLIFNQVENLTAIGPIVAAIRETIEDGNKKMESLRLEAFEASRNTVEKELDFYVEKGRALTIGYGQTGKAIGLPSNEGTLSVDV